jgi:hypothetical protein
MKPKKGQFYQHFKGTIYQVIGSAVHSESFEEMVLYKNLLEDKVWARPLSMFTDNHPSGVKRFEKVEI